ncbi:unnamed protein product, partial [marine sediment metagenome]
IKFNKLILTMNAKGQQRTIILVEEICDEV